MEGSERGGCPCRRVGPCDWPACPRLGSHATTPDHRLIVIDVESNGLYGQPFCVAAVLMDHGGRVLSDFISRCPLDQVPDEFVEEHVLPALDESGIEEDSESIQQMSERFVRWYLDSRDGAQAYVDCGFPVDVGFLRLAWAHVSRPAPAGIATSPAAPYPLHDVATLIASTGGDPLMPREEYARELVGVANNGSPHDPRWDAELSGLAAITAWRRLALWARARDGHLASPLNGSSNT